MEWNSTCTEKVFETKCRECIEFCDELKGPEAKTVLVDITELLEQFLEESSPLASQETPQEMVASLRRIATMCKGASASKETKEATSSSAQIEQRNAPAVVKSVSMKEETKGENEYEFIDVERLKSRGQENGESLHAFLKNKIGEKLRSIYAKWDNYELEGFSSALESLESDLTKLHVFRLPKSVSSIVSAAKKNDWARVDKLLIAFMGDIKILVRDVEKLSKTSDLPKDFFGKIGKSSHLSCHSELYS